MSIDRLTTAISTIPSWKDWLDSGGLSLALALTLIPIGITIGFLKLEVIRSVKTVAQVTAIALVSPAITEELFFRVLLLPHPTEAVSTGVQWLWICFSLVLFIAYHPLNALSFFPSARKTFVQPEFLTLAALLGIICTIAYLQTGSLWLPVAIHWLAVVVWLLLLGGYRRLYESPETADR